MTELSKTFDPAEIEARWYAKWENEGMFRPSRPDAEPFTIVIPPPNVTGSLHIGHALDNTLQDILIRHARLQGKDALWVVIVSEMRTIGGMKVIVSARTVLPTPEPSMPQMAMAS